VAAIALLKLARQSLKRWRTLPPAEQEQLRNDAERVRRLALELGGRRRLGCLAPARHAQTSRRRFPASALKSLAT